MRYFGYVISLLFICSMATASFVIPDHAVTQVKLATRATGTSVAAGGVAVSASSGNYTTTSGSPVAVTNLSVTIVTTGRPVFVTLIPDGSINLGYLGASQAAATTASSVFRFNRGGSDVAITNLNINGASGFQQTVVPLSSFSFVDFPAAGTYTYILKANGGAGTTTVYVQYAKLVAYEL